MSLDDIFGPRQGRPDHHDLTRLVNAVLAVDGKTEDPDFDMSEYLASLVDEASISYVAVQRALRLVAVLSQRVPTLERLDALGLQTLLAALSSLWIDGYLVRENLPPS